MITKRTLERWRIDSLEYLRKFTILPKESLSSELIDTAEAHTRIIRLTQDLLDVNLLQRGRQ